VPSEARPPPRYALGDGAPLTDPDVVTRILKHLEIPAATLPLLPALRPFDPFDVCTDVPVDGLPDDNGFTNDPSPRPRPARAPP
jgi:hypothetical protein